MATKKVETKDVKATEEKVEEKATKATTKKATTKAAAEKKEPAKKAVAKKAPAKKTTTTKKAAASKVEVFIEFGGVQVSVDEVIKNVKIANGKAAKNITVYVKPDESKAYFVADGEEKEMDVFFC